MIFGRHHAASGPRDFLAKVRWWAWRPCCLVLCMGTAWLFVSLGAHAEDPSLAARWIPFNELTATNRAQVLAVTDHYTLRRIYGPRQFKGRQVHFEFLMDHMEACSVLAQSLRLITYRATRGADGRVFADNREGASGYLTSVLITNGKRVCYVEGKQEGFFTARGRGVAVVDYRQKTPDTIEYTGAVFAKVDNAALAALAQLFAAFVQGAVDENFECVLRNPRILSEKAITEPGVLAEALGRMPVEDRQLLDPFAQLLAIHSNAPPPASQSP